MQRNDFLRKPSSVRVAVIDDAIILASDPTGHDWDVLRVMMTAGMAYDSARFGKGDADLDRLAPKRSGWNITRREAREMASTLLAWADEQDAKVVA